MNGPRSLDVPAPLVARLRELFASRGHALARNPRNRYIAFEVRTEGRSIFTLYTSGKLVQTVRDGDAAGHELAAAVATLLGATGSTVADAGAGARRASPGALREGGPSTRLLVGIDETGTGELFGQAIVGGARVDRAQAEALRAIVAGVDTKVARAASGWASLWERLGALEAHGARLRALPIPNALFDAYNKNELLDLAYVRVAGDLLADLEPDALSSVQIVVDDYGVGARLRAAIETWRGRGASVLVERKADERHLAARAGSVVAKAHRAREMAGLASEVAGGVLGSGNAGDARTRAWLRRWRATGAPWPSFVKASFRTVRVLDGDALVVKRPVPDPAALMDARAARGLQEGTLDVTSARLRVGSELVAHVDVDARGHARAREAEEVVAFLPLLTGGIVLAPDVLDADRLEPLLERGRGILCGRRVLVGPEASGDADALLALARAHRAGVVHVLATRWDDPLERAAREQAVLLARDPPAGRLALRLVDA